MEQYYVERIDIIISEEVYKRADRSIKERRFRRYRFISETVLVPVASSFGRTTTLNLLKVKIRLPVE